jgi:acetyltransferase-like isoleucine patch superfamily enzyme
MGLLPTIEVDGIMSDAATAQSTEADVHPTAQVAISARIGREVSIHADAQILDRASVGERSLIGPRSFVDEDVIVGAYVRILNDVSLCKGVMIESGVFIGPHVLFTSMENPRAIYPSGEPKPETQNDFECILVRHGASIEAGAILLPGVRIGQFAMVRPGSVVTQDVPSYGLVAGNPARLIGQVCRCGHPYPYSEEPISHTCPDCGFTLPL